MTALDRTAQTGPKKTLAPTGVSTHDGVKSPKWMNTNLVWYYNPYPGFLIVCRRIGVLPVI